jgi:hypothetical protein
MAAKVEANHAWLEHIIHQANNMSEVEFMLGLGGPIAGLKGSHLYYTFFFGICPDF